MALWRCPHCATLQPVASRCWVCKRSSTSCGTCRHFRASVAAKIGYCGLDRSREPLAGDEIRACWDGLPLVAEDAATPSPEIVAIDDIAIPGYVGGFVPVEVAAAAAVTRLRPSEPPRPRRRPPQPAAMPVAAPVTPAQPGPAPDGMLWADLEG